MNKIVHYIGLDVHKDSIAVAIAPQNSTEVRRYGIIGGTLDAVDNDVSTTMIYTHVLRQGGSGMKSPLDCL